MPEGHMWDPDVQTLSRGKLEDLQAERLERVVRRIWDAPVPFFVRKLEAAGLGPDDRVGLEDLPRVPFTVKDELRTSERASAPFGDYRGAKLHKCVRIGVTGGTSGTPTTVLWTRRDLEVENVTAARMFWRQGMRPGMIVSNAHPLGVYGGGRLLSGVMEEFGCLVMAVGSPESDEDARQAIELWRRKTPHAYQMFPSSYVKFTEAARAMGLDPESDLNLRAPQENPGRQYAAISAGNECMSFLGTACPEGGGAHVAEDYAIAEAVDEHGQPVPDGQMGEMVVTTLGRDNFLLRYNLEDLVTVNPRYECACGETHKRMKWEGRKKDLVTVEGRSFLPRNVAAVLFDEEELRTPSLEYQIVRRPGQERVEVRVERDPQGATALADLTARITAVMEERLGVPATIGVVTRGTLPRPAYKPERVVDA